MILAKVKMSPAALSPGICETGLYPGGIFLGLSPKRSLPGGGGNQFVDNSQKQEARRGQGESRNLRAKTSGGRPWSRPHLCLLIPKSLSSPTRPPPPGSLPVVLHLRALTLLCAPQQGAGLSFRSVFMLISKCFAPEPLGGIFLSPGHLCFVTLTDFIFLEQC